jgi:uncharacterized SAM-binding protein YcdF (DUF218 family)
MTQEEISNSAKIIWDYMHVGNIIDKSDAVFCLCSHDTRVAIRAADLIKNGYGKYLIFSGGSGKLTKNTFTKPEAEVFRDIAIEEGIDSKQIIVEPNSTNTGENVKFTYELIQDLGLHLQSFILVQKPYMERRTYATFKKQWPKPSTTFSVTSPLMDFDEYVATGLDKDEVINIMVGDLQRIKEYPKMGFQIYQEIPDEVWEAYKKLVTAGFNKHLTTLWL